MTTLIAIQTSDDVELGWDSQMTITNEALSLVTPKVFVNNGIIFGVSGTLRASDILETMGFPPFEGGNPRLWAIKEFVPELRAAIADESFLTDDDGCLEGWGFFMVVDGQVLQCDSVFNIRQNTEGIYTTGSGGDYARGALYAGATIMEALHVAARIDPYTGGALTVCKASKYLEASNVTV
jgi:ATP-dependent protease HslVU (ClpYQ), peptidase subunit